jgi:hypothetical protein
MYSFSLSSLLFLIYVINTNDAKIRNAPFRLMVQSVCAVSSDFQSSKVRSSLNNGALSPKMDWHARIEWRVLGILRKFLFGAFVRSRNGIS